MCLLFVCVSVSPRYIHISAQNSLEAQKVDLYGQGRTAHRSSSLFS